MERFVLPDLLRTIAIIFMVVYHFVFDLAYFWHMNIQAMSGSWMLLARLTAALFLFVVGMTFWLVTRKRKRSISRYLARVVQISLAAGLISFVTWYLLPDMWISFGILHLIVVSLLLLPLFLGLPSFITISIAVLIILLGAALPTLHTDAHWLIPLGFRPPDFASIDYFPLLPWFGYVLLGLGCAPWLLTSFPYAYFRSSSTSAMLFPGRHALIIYILHQPIIFIGLTLFLGSPQT